MKITSVAPIPALRGPLPRRQELDKERKCEKCKFCAWDPDGLYCGHRFSLDKTGGFGQGLNLARSPEGVCKPKGTLYKPCDCDRKGCPRHG